MLYKFRDGIITAKDTKTGVVVKARMVALRRLYDEGKELPEVFMARRALELLGRWRMDRKASNGRQ